MIAAVIALGAGPMLLAGLFSYMILDVVNRNLAQKTKKFYARWLSFLVFSVTVFLVSHMFISFVQRSLVTLPKIVVSVVPRAVELAGQYGFALPFEDAEELRKVFIATIQENVRAITKMSGLMSKRFFYIIVGMVIAALCFFGESNGSYRDNLFDAIRKELSLRIGKFMEGFEKVVGAQLIISGINTILTAIFLIITDLPYLTFLIPATFIVGILPILGNVISNTFIVGTALVVSPKLAVFALGFLIVIHKMEYFLNSKIVGSNLNAPMWQTLIGILVGEMVMGIPGIILAPALLYYIREEMTAIPCADNK